MLKIGPARDGEIALPDGLVVVDARGRMGRRGSVPARFSEGDGQSGSARPTRLCFRFAVVLSSSQGRVVVTRKARLLQRQETEPPTVRFCWFLFRIR